MLLLKRLADHTFLDDNLTKKLKNINTEFRAAGDVIKRKPIVSIVKGFAKPNNLNSLEKFAGTLKLTNQLAKDLLKKLDCSKCKGTTEKIEQSSQFLGEEK